VTKETKNRLLEMFNCFELLGESETLFVYVVIPLLCILALYIAGMVFYQVFIGGNTASTSAASDLLSIDPDKWFPRS
jgi:hypothetical protein